MTKLPGGSHLDPRHRLESCDCSVAVLTRPIKERVAMAGAVVGEVM